MGEHGVLRMGKHGVVRMGEHGILRMGESGALRIGENGVLSNGLPKIDYNGVLRISELRIRRELREPSKMLFSLRWWPGQHRTAPRVYLEGCGRLEYHEGGDGGGVRVL